MEDHIYEESSFPFALEKLSRIDRNNQVYAWTHQSTNSGAKRDDHHIDPLNGVGVHPNSLGRYVEQLSHPKKLDEMRERVRDHKVHIQFDGTFLIHHLFVVIASHYEEGEVVNTCLGLVDCDGRETYEGINSCISEVLDRANIDPSNVVGISCDRAAANIKYLREIASASYEGAVHLPCLCHTVDSVLGKANTPNFMEIAQPFCRYYKFSSKFRGHVNEFFQCSKNVPGLVATRWAYSIPFAEWLWEVRGTFREFIANCKLHPSFKNSQLVDTIHRKVNDRERDWGDALMETRFVMGLKEIAGIIKKVEGDGIRAISAFEALETIHSFDDVVTKVKKACRSDPCSSNLRDDVWEKLRDYLDSEIVLEESKMSNAINILDLLRVFNPYWLSTGGDLDVGVIHQLSTHIPLLTPLVSDLLDEVEEFCKSARRFTRNVGNLTESEIDRSILEYFHKICHDPRFPAFGRAIPIIAALQCTSAASERAFSRVKKQFDYSRHQSKLSKMEFELMTAMNLAPPTTSNKVINYLS